MTSGHKKRIPGLLRALIGFKRNRDGATAVEFGLLAMPFLLFSFAIIETCIAFGAQQLVSNAADDVARQLRTGQVVPGPTFTQAKLRQMICDRIQMIVSTGCPGLDVDLQQYTSFQNAADVKIIYTKDADGKYDLSASNFNFNPGGAMTKNMLRVFYRWPIITDIMRAKMSTLKNNNTLLFATATWENEPFSN